MLLRIFYLDDEQDLVEMFCDTFSSENREITGFNDPLLAIEAVKQNPPDIIFIDYRLPNYNGDQIAQMLNPEIPKFLITGDLQVDCTYQFKAIIQKPYKSEEIEKILESYSELRN